MRDLFTEVETKGINNTNKQRPPTGQRLQLRSNAIKRITRWVIVLALVLTLKPPYPHAAAKSSVANINNQEQAVSPPAQPVTTNAQPVIAIPAPRPQPVKPEPKPVTTPPAQPTGGKYDWMSAAGIRPSDYAAVDYIISHESGWNPNATNPNGGAHGLPQALPYSKTGCGWSDAVCQLRWATQYAHDRYGSWQGAYNFWRTNSWW